jgi:uncharacterized membrane protein (DUF2068 family)
MRVIALFEAAKGLLVLAAGTGLLLLIHHDVQAVAERLILHLHLNPASHYPEIFLRAATAATPWKLRFLALGALVYSIIRLTMAVGLWQERPWAEWLGVASGLIYLPFEIASFARHHGKGALIAIIINVIVVAFLAWRIRAGEKKRASGA